jgi:hypothetical protein
VLRVQVHAGGDDLQPQAGRLPDRAERGFHQPELGAGAGHEADPAIGSRWIAPHAMLSIFSSAHLAASLARRVQVLALGQHLDAASKLAG